MVATFTNLVPQTLGRVRRGPFFSPETDPSPRQNGQAADDFIAPATELRGLRRLKREQQFKSPFVFTSERGHGKSK